MKSVLFSIATVLLLSSCGEGSQDEDLDKVDLQESLDQLTEQMNDPVWSYKSHNGQFEIEIPNQMEERTNLNPNADLQFSYTERFMDETKENYLIVLSNQYDTDRVPVDDKGLMDYSERSLDSLMKGKESYELLNTPAIDTINGMSMVLQKVKATMAFSDTTKVDVFYTTGVYQGTRAHYQIVSWTLFDQRNNFEVDMERMVKSFKEKQ